MNVDMLSSVEGKIGEGELANAFVSYFEATSLEDDLNWDKVIAAEKIIAGEAAKMGEVETKQVISEMEGQKAELLRTEGSIHEIELLDRMAALLKVAQYNTFGFSKDH